jgi:hypothetical protein
VASFESFLPIAKQKDKHCLRALFHIKLCSIKIAALPSGG